MKFKKPYIDRASSTLVTEEETLSLTKLNIVFTQQDFERLINADNVTLFTCSYNTEKYELLCPLDKDKFVSEYISTYADNLAFSEEIYSGDFPNGYCYFPELWQSEHSKILILHYCH